jgi:hypothetical protein
VRATIVRSPVAAHGAGASDTLLGRTEDQVRTRLGAPSMMSNGVPYYDTPHGTLKLTIAKGVVADVRPTGLELADVNVRTTTPKPATPGGPPPPTAQSRVAAMEAMWSLRIRRASAMAMEACRSDSRPEQLMPLTWRQTALYSPPARARARWEWCCSNRGLRQRSRACELRNAARRAQKAPLEPRLAAGVRARAQPWRAAAAFISTAAATATFGNGRFNAVARWIFRNPRRTTATLLWGRAYAARKHLQDRSSSQVLIAW